MQSVAFDENDVDIIPSRDNSKESESAAARLLCGVLELERRVVRLELSANVRQTEYESSRRFGLRAVELGVAAGDSGTSPNAVLA